MYVKLSRSFSISLSASTSLYEDSSLQVPFCSESDGEIFFLYYAPFKVRLPDTHYDIHVYMYKVEYACIPFILIRVANCSTHMLTTTPQSNVESHRYILDLVPTSEFLAVHTYMNMHAGAFTVRSIKTCLVPTQVLRKLCT